MLEDATPVVTRSKGKRSQAVNLDEEACVGWHVKHSWSAKFAHTKISSSASPSTTVKKITTPIPKGNDILLPSSTHSMARRSHTIHGLSLL
jgi:hypothetical protein